MDGVILSGVIRPYIFSLTTKQNGNYINALYEYDSWTSDSPFFHYVLQQFAFHHMPPFLKRINSHSCYRWFAKRFLHPDVMDIYDFIFLWDEDLGVDNFNPRRYG